MAAIKFNTLTFNTKKMKTTNWLKQHIVELLAVIAVAQWLIVRLYILFADSRTDQSTTLVILSDSNSIAMLVLAFYFGSSKGSKDKQAKLDEINEKTNA